MQSSHNPSAALLAMVSCHTAECTFCSSSNSSRILSCALLDLIVERPVSVADKWENTGLRVIPSSRLRS
uniref:Putative secreted peptide n=1 Tax=Anopheles braziliensis TaxID=58242 RepID=A0A2M3ZUH7_9DIPT